MERVLLLLHTESDGLLSKLSLEAVAGAVQLSGDGSELSLGLIGSAAPAAATALAGSGAAQTYAVTAADFDAPRYASDAAAAAALVQAAGATVVLAPSTSRFARALPGVAQRVDGRIDTGLTGVKIDGGTLLAERWYYRQRMMATQTRKARPWFMTIQPGVFDVWTGEAGSVEIREVPVNLPDSGWRTSALGEETASSEAQTIRPDAALLFVAGAGWTKKQSDGETHVRDAENMIRNFLEVSRASLGSSKSLVDQSSEGQDVISFMTHLNQIGQTGATPRHRKGLSACCHGEEPHVVGWRFIKERRAINLDAGCGWAQGKADVVYVADAFEVVAKINEFMVDK